MDSKTYELISVQGSFDTEEKELEAKEKEMLADGYKIDVNFSTAHYYHKEFIRELPAAKDKAEVLTKDQLLNAVYADNSKTSFEEGIIAIATAQRDADHIHYRG